MELSLDQILTIEPSSLHSYFPLSLELGRSASMTNTFKWYLSITEVTNSKKMQQKKITLLRRKLPTGTKI